LIRANWDGSKNKATILNVQPVGSLLNLAMKFTRAVLALVFDAKFSIKLVGKAFS
jgi:hypothetical protein